MAPISSAILAPCRPLLAMIDGPWGPVTWAAVATAAWLAFLALVWWARRALLERIKSFAVRRSRGNSASRLRLVGIRQFLELAHLLVRMVGAGLLLGSGFLWLVVVMEQFGFTRPWAGRIEDTLVTEMQSIGLSALAALPGLVVVAVLFYLARLLHEAVNHYFVSIETGEMRSEVFDEVTAEITRRLAGVGIWVAIVVIAFPYIPGSGTPVFKGVSVLAGLMLSLGSANLVGQLVNGLVLVYARSIRPGDFIRTPQAEGTVERLGLFSCAIRNADDVVITLPNSTLAQEIRNFSRGRVGVGCMVATVTIGYDAPWRKVRELLLAAAGEVPAVRRDPAPWVRQAALEDFYVRYELVFAPEDPARGRRILSELHAAIQDRFHGAGVQIMSPHYLGDPASAKIPPGARAPAPSQS